MPNLSIPQLTAGDPAQASDLLPISRSGANFNITVGSITEPFGLIATDFAGSDLGAQVNAAYAALPSTGGTIYIPAGTYNNIATRIDLSSGKNVVLRGAGRGNTVLNFTLTSSEMILAGDSSTSGNLTLTGFTVAGTGAAHAGNYGIYINGANNPVLVVDLEIHDTGADAIVVSGSTAQVGIQSCYVRHNLNGYAVVCNSSGVENLTVLANEFFHNDGGVSVTANAGGVNICFNDIESDGSSQPMLNISSLGVYCCGNTFGCGPTSTNSDVALINTKAFNSTNDLFALGTSSQVALHITNAGERILITTPSLAAPGGGGGTGLQVDSGASFTTVINPSFYNGFATSISDPNATSTILTELAGKSKMYVDGPLTLSASTGLLSAATATVDNTSSGGIAVIAKAANGNSDIVLRAFQGAAAPTNDVIQSKVVASGSTNFNFLTAYTDANPDGSGGTPIIAIRGDGVIDTAGPSGFGNGSAGTAMTTTTLGTGTGPATPQTVVSYLKLHHNGQDFWLPLVQ
jgi:hypothetical protein